jgi:cytochrome c553
LKTQKLVLVFAVISLVLAVFSIVEVYQFHSRLKRLEATAPDVGEVMLGVHLHFAKLFYAGEAKNWKLAEFEIKEIEENLDTVTTLRPKENGVNLQGVADGFKQTQLAAMQNAVAKQDLDQFHKTYKESMATCNGCHHATGRPFLVVTLPKAPPVSNQQWEPPAQGQEQPAVK